MPEPTTWAYVDDRRTHEVRVALERGRTLDLVIRESAFGGAPRDEVYVERHTLAEPWEQKVHLLALETRLAQLGRYYKAAPGGWVAVRPATGPKTIELAALDLGEAQGTIEFHHFQEGTHAVSLVGVHQDTPRGKRSLLVRVDYEFPRTDGGNLQIVHAKLPAVLYKSALASLHLELAELRFRKLRPEEAHLGDPRSWAALRAALDGILARLANERHLDGFTDPVGRPLDARQLVAIQHAARAAKGAASSRARTYDLDDEIGPGLAAVEGKKPEVMIEALPPDVFGALQEPRLVALHHRFLTPARETELFGRGERAIHIAMRELRGATRPDEQHLVSLLEASLLLRYAMQKRLPVDPDVIKRVVHARAYL
jgi:hypothetical protein